LSQRNGTIGIRAFGRNAYLDAAHQAVGVGWDTVDAIFSRFD
jgi:hypothetical protein